MPVAVLIAVLSMGVVSCSDDETYAEQKERNKQIKKAEKAVEAAEQKVTQLEVQLADIEAQLATPAGTSDTALFTQYGELKTKLATAEDEWTEASMALEELKSEK